MWYKGGKETYPPNTAEVSYLPVPQSLRSGYKEKQYLVVVDSTYQPSDRDEKKEDSHCNNSSDDMDAGHQTQAP